MDDTQKPFVGLKTLRFAAPRGSIARANPAQGQAEPEEKLAKGRQEVPSCHAQPPLHEFPPALGEKRGNLRVSQGYSDAAIRVH